MNLLERRTAKLEQAACLDANQIDIIIRRIVSANGSNEIVRAKIGDRFLARSADEPEEAFIEHAKSEALASTDRRPCRMILQPKEVLQ